MRYTLEIVFKKESVEFLVSFPSPQEHDNPSVRDRDSEYIPDITFTVEGRGGSYFEGLTCTEAAELYTRIHGSTETEVYKLIVNLYKLMYTFSELGTEASKLIELLKDLSGV